MHNFPVKIDSKEFWISRSIAVCGLIFTEDSGIRILANKRGSGCPDEVGKWCCPCGYLDYNETLKQACHREIKEETNLTVNDEKLYLWHIDDNPKSNRQNVTITFYSYSKKYSYQTIHCANCEPNEVDDVLWINIDELDKYEWAFNHKCLIIKVCLETNLKDLLSEETKRRFEQQLK